MSKLDDYIHAIVGIIILIWALALTAGFVALVVVVVREAVL